MTFTLLQKGSTTTSFLEAQKSCYRLLLPLLSFTAVKLNTELLWTQKCLLWLTGGWIPSAKPRVYVWLPTYTHTIFVPDKHAIVCPFLFKTCFLGPPPVSVLQSWVVCLIRNFTDWCFHSIMLVLGILNTSRGNSQSAAAQAVPSSFAEHFLERTECCQDHVNWKAFSSVPASEHRKPNKVKAGTLCFPGSWRSPQQFAKTIPAWPCSALQRASREVFCQSIWLPALSSMQSRVHSNTKLYKKTFPTLLFNDPTDKRIFIEHKDNKYRM